MKICSNLHFSKPPQLTPKSDNSTYKQTPDISYAIEYKYKQNLNMYFNEGIIRQKGK